MPNMRRSSATSFIAAPLGFVLTALFVVLTMDAFQDCPDLCTLASAAGSAMVALLVAPASMLLVAMSVFAASLAARHHLTRRGRRPARA